MTGAVLKLTVVVTVGLDPPTLSDAAHVTVRLVSVPPTVGSLLVVEYWIDCSAVSKSPGVAVPTELYR
jgi:hypothetical protein